MVCSPTGCSVHGIFQARILERVAMPSSRESSWPWDQSCVSCISCIGNIGGVFTTSATWEAPPFHPYTGLVQHPVPLSQPHYHQDCVTRVPRCLGKGFPLRLLRRQPRECCSSHHVQCKGSGSDSTHRTSPNGKGAEWRNSQSLSSRALQNESKNVNKQTRTRTTKIRSHKIQTMER